ncbi:two-component sensor histidine kinase [Anaerocolumna sedimenticola]|uniref:histidine kinase n=1 Tax=Anaerocolumna sedimenticola TaxID=2696063 RepID=A0A6P1TKR4_9FIRM|nr:HAMP domain-containing sensor histidine kinase [Anaerocolumna sedimenticola]QHQ60235.1 two-component sensor histidine kinase [Anaerocolumna sedimenticola]
MFTKEEQQKLTELMNSNNDFAYYFNKVSNECKLLTSQISHELRNPLTLIKSTAQLIETVNPEVKNFKYWDQLKEDIDGLETLLIEVSKFNHSESVNKQKQNFFLLLKSIVSTFRPLAEQNGIELSLTIAEADIPYYISYSLDSVKISQVFTNLIRNAFEATESGCYINIVCKVFAPSYLTIEVQNNGRMIPPDELPTIFRPFVTYKSGGSGLGLAISSNIIAAHNGTIEVTSSEEKTSFIIQLPLFE